MRVRGTWYRGLDPGAEKPVESERGLEFRCWYCFSVGVSVVSIVRRQFS